MRVFVWATGQDTGGQGGRIASAFGRLLPDWQVDSLASTNPLGYPEQHPATPIEAKKLARRLYEAADVVHLRNNLAGYRGDGKPLVLHHHGSMFRAGHGALSAQARRAGAVQLASTLDLVRLERDVAWLPAPYDLQWLQSMHDELWEPSDVVRIAHFPTAAPIKSTGLFLAACEELRARGRRIEVLTNASFRRNRHPDVVRTSWAAVLAAKAKADIYFDQALLGYGNNAVEAWGLGLPVIAGVADPGVRAEMSHRFGSIPFAETTPATIYDTLERLVDSAAARQEYAARGLEHARRFHAEAAVVAQLVHVYEDAVVRRRAAA